MYKKRTKRVKKHKKSEKTHKKATKSTKKPPKLTNSWVQYPCFPSNLASDKESMSDLENF
jgi:hypothetical protein